MLKKVGIIGSGVAGITLLKALVDQTEERTSSQTNNLNLQIVLIERGRNFFDTFARSPSSNPVVVVHNPVTSRTEYQFFCNQGIKTMSSWIASLEDRFKTRIAHKPGLLHLPKNIHEQKKWEDIFNKNSFYQENIVEKSFLNKKLQKNTISDLGIWDPNGFWLNPKKFLILCLKDVARVFNKGAEILMGTEVRKIKVLDKGVLLTLRTNDSESEVVFDKVIMATGSKTEELLNKNSLYLGDKDGSETKLNLYTNSGQLSRFAIPKEYYRFFPNFIFCKGGYVTPLIRKAVYSGSSYDKIKNEDSLLIDKNNKYNFARMCNIYNKFSTNINVSYYRSERCTSSDKLPVVGKIGSRSDSDLYIFSALASRGFSYGPLLAEILATEIISEICNSSVENEAASNRFNQLVTPFRSV
ncbi:MAG: FAD-dependent oxidoreductase [Burkholderiaceae bacterium]|nr:MAG: FAD-dependent oxidoreductase [Burkholderiaceae bacterium]